MLDPHVIIGRFALVILYGAIIGIEREARHKTAGIKTNTLVALGAAGFAMVSNTFGPTNHNPAQIAAAVVTGIGFIGAGVIIHRGGSVQGVTTAATLWVNAAVGVTIGTGHLVVGSAIFAGVLFIQLTMRPIASIIARNTKAERHWNVRVGAQADALPTINETVCAFAPQTSNVGITRRHVGRDEDRIDWVVRLVAPDDANMAELEQQLIAVRGVQTVAIEEQSAAQSADLQ
jgi:uncharacterized membrane protein YhiD involved in acid resistance